MATGKCNALTGNSGGSSSDIAERLKLYIDEDGDLCQQDENEEGI